MLVADAAPEPLDSCRYVAIKSVRPQTEDPTSFEDDPVVAVAMGRHVAMEGVRIVLKRDGRVIGVATMDRLSSSGAAVRLRPTEGSAPLAVGAGTVTFRATGTRAAACEQRDVDFVGGWRFGRASLPVRPAPATPFVEDARKAGLQLYLRQVAGRISRGVRAVLRKDGRTVARGGIGDIVSGGTVATVGVPQDLEAGLYRLTLVGRLDGQKRNRSYTQPLFLGARGSGGSPPVDADAGLAEQRTIVSWSDSRAHGRDTAGFVAPGIGYGEITCGVKQQHIRFYPTDLGREQSMMLWAYKDWRENSEKSIRESIHTQFSGPSFQEGLNKFSPPEKSMTGEYEGLITDRGVLDAPYGASLAPPTSIRLSWEWDFSEPRKARCHIEAILRTENGNPTESRPLARSAQVVWRGDPNAFGHDDAAVAVPGVGTVTLLCQAGVDGTRTLTIDPATEGGAVQVREGGEDKLTNYGSGPLVIALPNNGQLKVGLFGGASVLVSSRWKVNDPRPGENSCKAAAQVVVQ